MTTVPAQQRAFIDAIILHPRDEHLRGVYADYLEEHGDPWADVVRGVMSVDEANAALCPLDFKRNIEIHLGPLAAVFDRRHFGIDYGFSACADASWAWRCGFPCCVSCGEVLWLDDGCKVVVVAPIEEVSLYDRQVSQIRMPGKTVYGWFPRSILVVDVQSPSSYLAKHFYDRLPSRRHPVRRDLKWSATIKDANRALSEACIKHAWDNVPADVLKSLVGAGDSADLTPGQSSRSRQRPLHSGTFAI